MKTFFNLAKIALALQGIVSAASAQTISSITNAASAVSGAVSPGEIVVLNGTAFGPAALSAAPIPGPGTLPTTLGGISVTFNGLAAPIVYVSGTQISVQVPYGLGGTSSATVVLKTGGLSAPAFTVPVVLSAPGLFTLDYSGTGQVVALNTNGLNSTKNAAPKGTSVLLFATGEGITAPVGVDGVIQTTTVVRMPIQSVSVQIAGTSATVLFAGSVPGDVTGVLEIGVIVPTTISGTGSVPVILSIGGVATTRQTTIAVQ